MISSEPLVFFRANPKSTRLLDYIDGNGVASVTDGRGKIEFTYGSIFRRRGQSGEGYEVGENLNNLPEP